MQSFGRSATPVRLSGFQGGWQEPTGGELGQAARASRQPAHTSVPCSLALRRDRQDIRLAMASSRLAPPSPAWTVALLGRRPERWSPVDGMEPAG